MLPPRKVQFAAKKKEKENIEFRTFLKIHAEEEELDRQFLALHREVFASYDCGRCRNCCKKYYGVIPAEDLEKAAASLLLSVEELKEQFLNYDEIHGQYETKHMPCDFLQKDGSCRLGDCRPENCKKYPYTDQTERLSSLYSVLEAVSVCPAAFEIWERLKEKYGFRYQ